MLRRLVLLITIFVPLYACASIKLTRTGEVQPPRDPHCDFDVFTAHPDGFVEIGTIDIDHQGISDVAVLKRSVQPYVCAAGGDAALATINGNEIYVQATVLRSSGSRTSSDAMPAAGCQYDTQCKGDRICQKGECVEPATKL